MLAATIALLCVVSCASAGKRRSVTPGTTAAPQWTHEWARGAVFYEIFVRSFADSNGDGIGDFNGMTAKLDYLDQMGVDGIWLMPMFESTSYHGYDTTDYDNVERDYGTSEDFQRFLAEAHRRDIRVIVDLVLNHTSVEHPWFVDSASSTASPKRDWFVWSATDPGWKQPWGGNDPSWHLRNGAYYYGAFWSGMPDVNYNNAAAKAEMFRITRHWLLQGVDGYRLDATRYLVETGSGEAGQADTPGTYQVLSELSLDVRKVKPDAILVAENTVDTAKLATYFGSMPSNFNFPLAGAIVDGVKNGHGSGIRNVLRDMLRLYPSGVIDAPFLTNHDQTRIATILGNDTRKVKNAAAILLTLPGMPFIYYGEEVGMQNGPASNDEAKRTPMPWTPSGGFSTATPWHAYAPGLETQNVATQSSDPNSVWSHYRNWIAVRKGSPALMKGDIAPIETISQILAFTRTFTNERVLVVHNVSDSAHEVVLPLDAAGFHRIHAESDPTGNPGAWRVTLPARASAVWRLR